MSKSNQIKIWLAILSLLFYLISCGGERRTEVELEGGNPPIFVMSGSGSLAVLSIGEVKNDKTLPPSQRSEVLWKIVSENEWGEKVENLGKITYGIVPRGYKQTTPVNEALPLVAGKYYYYSFVTADAPQASGHFTIKDGKAVSVKNIGICFKIVDGREIEVPCDEDNDNSYHASPTTK